MSNSCDPMDCSPPGSSVDVTLQARILGWVAISFSRGSSWPRNQTQVSCTAGRWFTNWAMREVPKAYLLVLNSPSITCLYSFWFLCWIWMRALLGRVILVIGFFPFITLNISCLFLLDCRVSAEKWIDKFMRILFVIYFPVAFNIFFVF